MSESPYELEQLVTVATFSTPWEAQVAQARLAAEGLSALIADEHVIRMVALSNAIGGIRLRVRERDAGAAAEVLRRIAPLPEIYLLPKEPAAADAEPGELRCPGCGGGDLQIERSSRMVLGVLPVARKGYRCDDCGVLWKVEEVAGAASTRTHAHAGAEAARAASGGQAPGDGGGEIREADAAGDAGRPEDAPLVTVARFHTPWEAHLARTLLESEGVRCCVLEERLPAVNLLSATPVAWNRLEVCQADASRAAEILTRAWSCQPLAAVPDLDPPEAADP